MLVVLPLLGSFRDLLNVIVRVPVRNRYKMGDKGSPKRRWFPRLRFSLPQAPAALLKRMREDFELNPDRYERARDLFLYGGVLLVLVLSVYVFVFAQ